MTGLITDLEDVFRPSLPLALTPTAHTVPTVASSSPTEDNPSLPISLLWGLKGPNSCQGLDTGLLQSQTSQSREESVPKKWGGKKTQNKPQTKNPHATKTKQTNPKNPLNPFPATGKILKLTIWSGYSRLESGFFIITLSCLNHIQEQWKEGETGHGTVSG